MGLRSPAGLDPRVRRRDGGVDGAVAAGGPAAGGHTIGVIPRALVAMEVADHDADELVVTDDMRERKGIMDARSDAFLGLPGGLGTLEELLEVWVARSLGMHAKPIVVLDPDGTYAGLRTPWSTTWCAARSSAPEARDAVEWARDGPGRVRPAGASLGLRRPAS